MNTLCPICEAPVLDYAPGESYTEIDGIRYHPDCYEQQGEELSEALADYLMKATAWHIKNPTQYLNEKFMAAVRKADDMQDKVEIARVIRDAWGPMTYMIEEEA